MNPTGKAALEGRAGKPCPVCGKPATPDDHPFCSRRCADVDLHRWLGGIYAVAGSAEADDEPSDGGEE